MCDVKARGPRREFAESEANNSPIGRDALLYSCVPLKVKVSKVCDVSPRDSDTFSSSKTALSLPKMLPLLVQMRESRLSELADVFGSKWQMLEEPFGPKHTLKHALASHLGFGS